MRAPPLVLVAMALAAGCGATHAEPAPAPQAAARQTTFALALPAGPRATSPSQMRVVARDALTDVDDVETCASCHADVAAEWRTSAHAFASFDNPVYRAAVARFRAEKGDRASRFCGGCHDVSLTADGAMDGAVAAGDPRAHAGVTCRTCHGIQAARPDGNGSYDLAIVAIELPKDGDPASVERHKRAAAPSPLRTAAMCTTCHRAFLDESTGDAHHLAGQDDATPLFRSVYSTSMGQRIDAPVARADCRGCHMPEEDAVLGDAAAKNGKITSHRFLGANTYLAAMRHDPATLARVRAFLQTAATIDIAAVTTPEGGRVILPEGTPVRAGDRVVADVVIRNAGVGHRFPGGVLDAQDTWVEVRAYDARGALIADAGARHATADDPTAHVLRAVLLDGDGEPVLGRQTDLFRVAVTNSTLAPRDAEVVRYALDVPAGAAQPLRLEARLRHRTRNLEVRRRTCEAERTREGRAFAEGQRKLAGGAAPLDGCVDEPITELGTASVVLGEGGPERDASRDFARAYDYGLGLLHALQEHLDDARAPLLFAEGAARTGRQRAMAEALLGQLAAKQGRPDEAFAWVRRAEDALAQDALRSGAEEPFLDRVRGRALAQVWRFDEAAPFLQAAADAAPRDDSSWAELAVDLGSAGRARDALEAAQRGLLLQPRDADCLRVQALSLEALGAPDDVVTLARDAYLVRRPPDDGAAIKAKCSAKVPGCALERDPVHLHGMRAD